MKFHDPDSSSSWLAYPEDEGLPRELKVSSRAISQIAEDQRKGANELTIQIGPDVSHFRVLVTFELKLQLDMSKIDRLDETPIDLLGCWLNWPPTQPPYFGMNPSSRKRELITWNHCTPKGVQADRQPDFTRFKFIPASLPDCDTITLRFQSSSCYFALSEESFGPEKWYTPNGVNNKVNRFMTRQPFTRHYFSIGIELSEYCCEQSIIQVITPDTIAIRSRSDNSRYYSTSLGIDDPSVRRNTSVFRDREIDLYYVYGVNDSERLATPAFPALRAGIGMLAGAFGLHLLLLQGTGAGLPPNLPTLAFGLMVAPWFIEAFRRRRWFFPSSANDRASWEDLSVPIFGFFHLAYVIPVLIALGWQESWREPLAPIGFVSGMFAFLLSISYFVSLWCGELQRYACDHCGRWLHLRRGRRVVAPIFPLLPKFVARRLAGFIATEDPYSRRVVCWNCLHPQRGHEPASPSQGVD